MTTTDPLVYSDNDGVKAIVSGEITFYFNDLEDRSRLANAYALALQHIGSHLGWYRTESMRRPKKITPEVSEILDVWLAPEESLRNEYELTLTSGDTADSVGSWGLRFGLEPDLLPEGAGFFQLNLSRKEVADDPNLFLRLALDLSELMPFRSGHAGFGVQYDEGDIDDDRDAQIGAWCRRYACIDYRDFAATSEFMGKAILGPGWLTFLDWDFATALGGEATIRAALPPEAALYTGRYGIAIQAGSEPILGDANRRENIALYSEVYGVIHPLIIHEEIDFPGLPEGTTADWIGRFARSD